MISGGGDGRMYRPMANAAAAINTMMTTDRNEANVPSRWEQ